MWKQDKNMAKLPGVNHKQAVKAFEKAGFWIARQGKHITIEKWRAYYYHSEGKSD